MGWMDGTSGDSARVKRALGLLPAGGGPRLGYRRYSNRLVDAGTAMRMAEALGVMPWEVMPDEDATDRPVASPA
jgi:hypothetical protein